MPLSPMKKSIPIWQNLRLLYFFAGSILALTVSSVMKSSWSGDDWPNSQTPYWIKWRYGSISPMNIWYEAQYWNNQWMQGQGRFYAVSWIESRFAFSYFRELWQYKLLETLVLFAAAALFVLLVYKVSRSHSLALLTLISISITIQFRRDFDPHIAFVFMVPSLLIKVFLSAIFAYHSAKTKSMRKGLGHSLLSGIFLFIAMSTYEYAFLLFPIVLLSFYIGNRHAREQSQDGPMEVSSGNSKAQIVWKLVPIVGSWLGYAIYVFGFLRTKAAAISGAYVLGISPKSIPTFLSQLVPPWPLTVFKFSDFSSQTTSLALIGFAFIAALVGTLFLYGLFVNSFSTEFFGNLRIIQERKYLLVVLLLISADLMLSPAFMLSIQREWWDRANITHSYLGILISEFGSALLLSLFISLSLSKNLKVSTSRILKRGKRK